MDVRKLTDPKDWLESERVIETAFLHPWDETEARERIQTQANGSLPRPEVSWGLFDGDTMLTSISTLQHQLSFGGEVINAGEFHMVGSLPERRGGGGVRRLFGEILRDFRAQGDVLAVLIPFSCAFYRKFGFEVATLVMDQRVAIDQLAGFSCDLRVTRVWNEADLAPVRALWDAHARSCNLAEVRDDAAWVWHGNGDYGASDFLHPDRQRYTYVLWDTKDNPCAYLRFSFFHQPDLPFVGELKVDDFVWNSPLALRSALGFLYRMRAKVSHINFELPDLDLSTLVPESDRVEQRIDSHVMARLLDPETLLRLMPQPYDTGSYVLGIEDAFLPEAAGRWQVAFETGRATAVKPTDREPDLVVDETTATQLILGRIALGDALYRPDVQLIGNAEVLAHAFTRRPVYLTLG